MFKKVSSFFCILFFAFGFSQNLIKNSSFEDYQECPNSLGTFGKNVNSWSSPTSGTTDYFNTCSKVMSAPENFNGIQYTKDGEAYAGLYFYAPGDYREYIQVSLKQKLRADKEYTLSFYISLAEGSDFAVKDFGVVCSYKPISVKTKKELSKGRLYSVKGNRFHSFEINHPKFHEDKSDWLRVTTSFVAKGYEKYLIIGNLRNNKLTRKVQTRRKETKKGAYYYIDKVSLIREGFTEEIVEEELLELDTKHHFKNVLFDFDEFKLNTDSKKEIEKLYNYLDTHIDNSITILGHTDDKGTDTYNRELSTKRAKSIVNYLIALGLSKDRITYKGYGSKQPLSTNTTDMGRKENRRVEFVLKEN